MLMEGFLTASVDDGHGVDGAGPRPPSPRDTAAPAAV